MKQNPIPRVHISDTADLRTLSFLFEEFSSNLEISRVGTDHDIVDYYHASSGNCDPSN